jgi:DNA modification methylase
MVMTQQFETTHEFKVDDARFTELEKNSVDLVITSPPYPMIEMWDDQYDEVHGSIKRLIDTDRFELAFREMHEVLNVVWGNVKNAIKPGGIVCINIGDATRKTDEGFKMFSNRAKIIDFFVNQQSSVLGNSDFNMLPEIVWRKPANSLNKFMGSGMLPTNAYVTHEHEFILIFRNGQKREFEPHSDNRYESAFFWEERNTWFSDTWTDILGIKQDLGHDEARERSGAFPLDLPYRLINMFSVYGDTVLDPFAGVGTTSLASIVAGRNSISIDIEESLSEIFLEEAKQTPSIAQDIIRNRLLSHLDFVESNGEHSYQNDFYDIPVKTKQEKNIRFYKPSVDVSSDKTVTAKHVPYQEDFDS